MIYLMVFTLQIFTKKYLLLILQKFILYHKTMVDIMMSTNPDGLIFIPIEEWY